MRRNDGDRQKDGFGRFQNPLSQLNFTVQILLSARSIEDNADKLAYIWDTIDLVARFLLLNQTQVAALSYNVTQQAQLNLTNLNWAALPMNVQVLLINQTTPAVYNLSFVQWAWVDSSNPFASSNLNSLLLSVVQSTLPNALIFLAPISYNTQIDLTVLNQTFFTVAQNCLKMKDINAMRSVIGT